MSPNIRCRVTSSRIAVIVADDGALITPFAAQHVVQQPGVGVRRDAVDLVVRGHDRLHRESVRMARSNGGKKSVAQLTLAEMRRADVGAAFGLAVAGEMLERHEAPCRTASGSVGPWNPRTAARPIWLTR